MVYSLVKLFYRLCPLKSVKRLIEILDPAHISLKDLKQQQNTFHKTKQTPLTAQNKRNKDRKSQHCLKVKIKDTHVEVILTSEISFLFHLQLRPTIKQAKSQVCETQTIIQS